MSSIDATMGGGGSWFFFQRSSQKWGSVFFGDRSGRTVWGSWFCLFFWGFPWGSLESGGGGFRIFFEDFSLKPLFRNVGTSPTESKVIRGGHRRHFCVLWGGVRIFGIFSELWFFVELSFFFFSLCLEQHTIFIFFTSVFFLFFVDFSKRSRNRVFR